MENLLKTTGDEKMNIRKSGPYLFSFLCCLILFGFSMLYAQDLSSGSALSGDTRPAATGALVFDTGEADRVMKVPDLWPIAGGKGRITLGYGIAMNPLNGKDFFHSGLDIAWIQGTDITAAAEGKVIETGNDSEGYGSYVLLDHGSGVVTFYAHLATVDVKAGDAVFTGMKIATLGNTGKSTGPHLHYEIRLGDGKNPVDPRLYIKSSE